MKTYLVIYKDWEPIEIKADTFRANEQVGVYEFLQGETVVAAVPIFNPTICVAEKGCLTDG